MKIIYLFLAIVLITSVHAAPPPEPNQLAIQKETNECGYFQSYDGIYDYEIAENWTIYNTTTELRVIEKCTVPIDDFRSIAQCYVDFYNYQIIPKENYTEKSFEPDNQTILDEVFYNCVDTNTTKEIFIDTKNEVIVLLNQSCDSRKMNSWTITDPYFDTRIVTSITTEYGVCDLTYEECCSIFNMTYVGEIGVNKKDRMAKVIPLIAFIGAIVLAIPSALLIALIIGVFFLIKHLKKKRENKK